MCDEAPTPPFPINTLFGLAPIHAISSFSVLAGTAAFDAMTWGLVAIIATGSRSVSRLYGSE